MAKKSAQKRKPHSFSVDCTKPVEDRIMDLPKFEQFLAERIKVNGKAGELGHSLSRAAHLVAGARQQCSRCDAWQNATATQELCTNV